MFTKRADLLFYSIGIIRKTRDDHSLDEMHGCQPYLDPILLLQLPYFVDVSFHGVFLGSPCKEPTDCLSEGQHGRKSAALEPQTALL